MIKTKKTFYVKPNHWYWWLWPTWWSHKRILEEIMNQPAYVKLTEKLLSKYYINGELSEQDILDELNKKGDKCFMIQTTK